MNLFNIFRRKKASNKRPYPVILDKMWVCVVNFRPWDPDNHKVVFKPVDIVKAEADTHGIYVSSDEENPFTHGCCTGYVGELEGYKNSCGFFETEDAAKKAYNDLMNSWIAVIKSKLAV